MSEFYCLKILGIVTLPPNAELSNAFDMICDIYREVRFLTR